MVIPLFKVFMAGDIENFIVPTLRSGYIGQGQRVDEFELSLQSWFKTQKSLLTTNSATNALHLLLHILKRPQELTRNDENFPIQTKTWWPGIAKDDEILCTPLSCTATANPITLNGLKIKWVDIDPETLNISLDDLEKKITARTRVIIFVHWGGSPLDLDRLRKIQHNAFDKYEVMPLVIEDCAHAIGATYNGQHVGTTEHDNFSFYSFQAIKHLTCSDGGAAILPYKEIADQFRLERWFGLSRTDGGRAELRCNADVEHEGWKFHLTDVNAVIGLANIRYLSDIVLCHKANGLFFDLALRDISGITLLKRPVNSESSYWIYTLKVEDRDNFERAMNDRGIHVSRVHHRLDKHSCFKEFAADLPGLEEIMPKYIAIPAGWWLTAEDRNYIVNSIKRGW